MTPLWKKKMRSISLLLFAAIGVVLLVAGVSKKSNKECKDVKVEVTGVNRHIFIDEKEVLKLLNANGDLVGKEVKDINLQVLENRLENDKWIKNAELFFDNNQVLEVKVEEREPVARIFTVEGNSYYIDSSTSRLPLSDKMSVRVPMFTNFPTDAKKLRSKDSALMVSVKELATFIQADSFWNAQVAQINITPNRTFEMVPTIGNHIVLLGKGSDVDKKFQRLFSFYKEVWTKVGMEKYSIIDVQYKGQVIATRRGEGNIYVDSSKAREAFFNLINRNKPDTVEEDIKVRPAAIKVSKPKAEDDKDATASSLTAKVKSEIAKSEAEKKSAGAKSSNSNGSRPVKNDDKPRAVMKKH